MTDDNNRRGADKQWASRQARTLLETRRRIEGQNRLDPQTAIDLAKHQLNELYGTSSSVFSAFRNGVVGYLADHVHYMPGYALFSSSRGGIAVALQPGNSNETRTSVWPEGSSETFGLGDEGDEKHESRWWSEIVAGIARQMNDLPDTIDVSIVSAISPCDENVFLATLAVAIADALTDLAGTDDRLSDTDLSAALDLASGYHHSPAYITAVRGAQPGNFSLVDSENCEIVNFGVGGDIAAGFIEAIEQPRLDPAFVTRRREDAHRCLIRLKESHTDMPTLAHLQHRDLKDAEKLLPRRLRSTLNYLVKENQRVQRAVTAARKGDWQFFGGLLFMSNAALLNDWGLNAEHAAYILDLIQERTTDGLVGGRIIGNGRGVYILGRPFSVPDQLDDIRRAYKDNFGSTPRTELL